MNKTQKAYAVAKAALQAAIEVMAIEGETCPFEEGTEEYYAFGDMLSEKYHYVLLTDNLREAEEAMMLWAHNLVMKLPMARKHIDDLVLVFESRNRLVTVRHQLIDMAFRLNAK